MDEIRPLTPCFIGSGTLTDRRDMVRALETLDALDFRYEVDGEMIFEGAANLMRLMVDAHSSTIEVNGCLFLNVSSFRYMDFGIEDDLATFRLYGDGSVLWLRADPLRDAEQMPRRQLRLLEDTMFDVGSFVIADDEEDED